LAWADPVNETWELGNYGAAELHAALIADGSAIDFASNDDIERAGLKDQENVTWVPDDLWISEIERFNRQYALTSDSGRNGPQ
jgi:hypothetical protein